MEFFENKFRSWCRNKGWTYKKQRGLGIPDFIIYKNVIPNMYFIEVKGTHTNKKFNISRLSEKQQHFFAIYNNISKVFYINKPHESLKYEYFFIVLDYNTYKRELFIKNIFEV